LKRSKRFEKLDRSPVNQDSFFVEWAEGGLSALRSPYDPDASLVLRHGRIEAMDGKEREEFDSLEAYIADFGINIESAEEAMALSPGQIARMIVDINVSRQEVLRVTTAITPAKMLQVVQCLNAVEMMMGQMKMRARRRPANQAIVTNVKDNPALLAADAAEATLRGFAEVETTCAVSRYAPFNALAILIGSQACRGGVLTQCSMEESLEIKMGMRGLTSYAETVSLYGTEAAMDDGDDTIWSKAFLASVYASRGMKMRFTSGTGSEVLLGHSNKKSMLYLEILCVYLARACGAQGVQNGSISCIGITTAVPEGFLAIAAENLVVSLLGMEVASGNDQAFSHSDLRRTAKLLMQMMPGTDFITSGYSATPNFDDLFAGSNTDCDDYDDYYMMQRDMQIDGGIEPVAEADAIRVRHESARACQAVFRELGFPLISDAEVDAATFAYSNEEMPPRNISADLVAAQEFFHRGGGAIDLVRALHTQGFAKAGENLLRMLKQRICGDYLQVAAIIDNDFSIRGGINDPNDYVGPGSGYRLEGQRWEKLKQKDSALVPQKILEKQGGGEKKSGFYKWSEVRPANFPEADIVIGLSPAFLSEATGVEICSAQELMLQQIIQGIAVSGMSSAVVKVFHVDNLAEIALLAASFSASGIGIGVQSKGLVRINSNARPAEDSLEVAFNLPFSKAEVYKEIGINAADYAQNRIPTPVAQQIRAGGLTNYQLQMIKLSAQESGSLERRKKPFLMEMNNRSLLKVDATAHPKPEREAD